jgi:uncharacterized protein
MDRHEFVIPAHDLDAGGKDFHFPVRVAWLLGVLEGLEIEPVGDDGKLDVRASKSGNDVIVHGHLKLALKVPCARCLKDVALPIDKDVSALAVHRSVVKGSKGDDDEYEFSAEEADVVPFDGDTVYLDDLVRDEIALEAPMIPLCSEDCPGIDAPPASPVSDDASATGTRDVDPRLAPLLQFKVPKSSKKES